MLKTLVLREEKGIKQAAELILNGEVVAFATETVYGLGADYKNIEAVERIFKLKGRPHSNPLIVHLAKPEDVHLVADDVPKVFFELAKHFMPGPLSVILKKNSTVPDIVSANTNTVAIRVPNNYYVRKLIELSSPLAAPSANKSSFISPTSAEHVLGEFEGRIPLVLDGGECNVGIESTLLDLTTATPTILRQGSLSPKMLSKVLDAIKVVQPKDNLSLGCENKFSLVCKVVVASSADEAKRIYDEAKKEGFKPVYLCYDEQAKAFDGVSIAVGSTNNEVAKNFYSQLRLAEQNFDFFIVQKFTGDEIAQSIMERVRRLGAEM